LIASFTLSCCSHFPDFFSFLIPWLSLIVRFWYS
jgi:hypothetical protein